MPHLRPCTVVLCRAWIPQATVMSCTLHKNSTRFGFYNWHPYPSFNNWIGMAFYTDSLLMLHPYITLVKVLLYRAWIPQASVMSFQVYNVGTRPHPGCPLCTVVKDKVLYRLCSASSASSQCPWNSALGTMPHPVSALPVGALTVLLRFLSLAMTG